MDEIVKQLKETGKERMKSPFFGTALVSWMVINYPVVLCVLAINVSAWEKIVFITNYKQVTGTGELVFYPLCIAAAYVFVYPIVDIATSFIFGYFIELKARSLRFLREIETYGKDERAKLEAPLKEQIAELTNQLSIANEDVQKLADKHGSSHATISKLKAQRNKYLLRSYFGADLTFDTQPETLWAETRYFDLNVHAREFKKRVKDLPQFRALKYIRDKYKLESGGAKPFHIASHDMDLTSFGLEDPTETLELMEALEIAEPLPNRPDTYAIHQRYQKLNQLVTNLES